MSYSIDKDFIVENLGYRLGVYHPGANIQVGMGNSSGDVVVVQPHSKMPERDSITGALKRFGMLDDAFRATTLMVDYEQPNIEYPDLVRQNRRHDKPKTQKEINRYYLKELIEIIKPVIVVACGQEVVELLRGKKVRSFKAHSGKKFKVEDLPKQVFYATLNPMDYGFARAPADLKVQGKAEWEKLEKLYRQLKETQEKERWS